jgi:hypothetical protein
MALTKRIWIEKDPAYAVVRAKFADEAAAIIAQHPFGAPLRRKNRLAASPHWDPLWSRRLHIAAEELKHDHITVNSRMMFRTEKARDATMQRAEVLWAEELERRGSRRR